MKPSSIINVLVAALLIVGSASSGVAEKKRERYKGTTVAFSPVVMKGAVKRYGNNLTTQVFSIKKGESQFSVEYPIAGSSAIVNPLRKQIAEWIVGSDRASRFSSLDNPEQMLKSEIKQYAAKVDMGMSGETKEVKIDITYSNSKIVTINYTGYLYAGGAHGMDWDISATFLRADGSRFTQSMLPRFSVLRPYILKGLAKEMDCSVNELCDIIYIKDLEYPSSDPYITADGLCFTYGAYEIGPYSIGLPKATIPLQSVRSLMPSSALKFF